MDRKLLESYRPNKRLIERNKKKIEDECFRDIPVVMGKVTGSSNEFPYTEQRISVLMDEPVEADKVHKRIIGLNNDINLAESEIEQVEKFIAGIQDTIAKEIFTYRYLDGLSGKEVAAKVMLTNGRVSQIISDALKY